MEDFDSKSSSDAEVDDWTPYWRAAHWNGGKLPEIGARGYFTLFVTQPAETEAWAKISRLTQENQLGHYSAIAPEPMHYGLVPI